MSTQLRQRIRLALDVTQLGTLVDSTDNQIPLLIRNTDVQLEMGFFYQGQPINITPWQSVTASVIPVGATSPLYSQSVSRQNTLFPEGGAVWFDNISSSGFEAGTQTNVTVVFSSTQTNMSMANTYETYQLVITSQSLVNNSILPSSPSYSGGSYSITLPAGSYYASGGGHENATAAIQLGSAVATSLVSPTGFSLSSLTTVTLYSSSGFTSGTVTAYISSSGYAPVFVAGVGVVNVADYGVGFPNLPQPGSNIEVVNGVLCIYDNGTNSFRQLGCTNGALFVS